MTFTTTKRMVPGKGYVTTLYACGLAVGTIAKLGRGRHARYHVIPAFPMGHPKFIFCTGHTIKHLLGGLKMKYAH